MSSGVSKSALSAGWMASTPRVRIGAFSGKYLAGVDGSVLVP